MQDQTAKRLRRARHLLGRDFGDRERSEILARMRRGDRLTRVDFVVCGRKRCIGLWWPDVCQILRPGRTYLRVDPGPAAPQAASRAHAREPQPRDPVDFGERVARPRSRGAGKPGTRRRLTRSSARSGDSGDDSESSEPAERRLCENQQCEADISHLHPLRLYCNDACRQQAYRDRQTVVELHQLVGTTADPELLCRHGRLFDGELVDHGELVEDGRCITCGHQRGGLTRAWLDDGVLKARSVIVAPRGLPGPRVRPDRELAAKLKKTRSDRKVAA